MLFLANQILRFEGKPYSLNEGFYHMEPMFRARVPSMTTWVTGRQVAKSLTLAARILIRGAVIPYHNVLTMTPMVDQMQRFNKGYIRPFIESSPCRSFFEQRHADRSVQQRVLPNGTILYFSFALMSCDRIRGIPARELNIDEMQDFNIDFLPVARETMSASKHGSIESHTGTPKTLDGPLEILRQESSQAEWAMRCGCGHTNIPNIANGVLNMIQPKGLSCCKCDRLLEPESGFWLHAFRDRVHRHAGYHVPQVILPLHCRNPIKWNELIYKMHHTEKYRFINECLGESWDTGARLVSQQHLQDSCSLPWGNNIEEAVARSKEFSHIVMAVDWSGHGADEISFTCVGMFGLTGSGKVCCIYGERFPITINESDEIKRIVELYRKFDCHLLAHDYGGAGSLREVMLTQSGVPAERIMPILWTVSASSDLWVLKAPENTTRTYYSVDKTRALSMTAAMIRGGLLLHPKYDDMKPLLSDWMSLFEDHLRSNTGGRDVYRIRRQMKRPDDFAQMQAFGTVGICFVHEWWPNLAAAFDTAAHSVVVKHEEEEGFIDDADPIHTGGFDDPYA